MPHAVLVDDFIPSKEEAQNFEDEWRKAGEIDYQYYQKIQDAFSTGDFSIPSLKAKCQLLDRAYHCGGRQSCQDIAGHLYRVFSIEENKNRLKRGDMTLVDEIRATPNGNLYVLAAMFCHHSNPDKYYAYSGKVKALLSRLNLTGHFLVHGLHMRKYSQFDENMRSFVHRYNLEDQDKTKLDVMISRAYNLYRPQLI